jgi:hypothetical protein
VVPEPVGYSSTPHSFLVLLGLGAAWPSPGQPG